MPLWATGVGGNNRKVCQGENYKVGSLGGKEEMEVGQMRTGVEEEVMGNEVVAQSNLLRGPGERSA